MCHLLFQRGAGGATHRLPKRQLAAPRPTYPWLEMVMGPENEASHGSICRVNVELGIEVAGFFDRIALKDGCALRSLIRMEAPSGKEERA